MRQMYYGQTHAKSFFPLNWPLKTLIHEDIYGNTCFAVTEDCLAGEYSGLTENKTCAEIGSYYPELCEKRFVRQRCCVACKNHTSVSTTSSPGHTTSSTPLTTAQSTMSESQLMTLATSIDLQCKRKHGNASYTCRVC